MVTEEQVKYLKGFSLEESCLLWLPPRTQNGSRCGARHGTVAYAAKGEAPHGCWLPCVRQRHQPS